MRSKAELKTPTEIRHGFRGVPEPPTFSLAALADDCFLDQTEVAAILRVSISALEVWRRNKNHALKWEVLPGGFIRYRAGALRAYIAMGAARIRGPNKPKPAAPNASPTVAPITQNAPAPPQPSPKRKRVRRTAERAEAVE